MTPAKLIKFKIRNEKIRKHFLMVMPLNKPMIFTEIVNGFAIIEKDLEPEFQNCFYSLMRISTYLNNVLIEQGIVKKEERIFTRIK